MYGNSEKKVGKVYLVGAGPGDPDLLTLKALKILKKAEVVVYDYLANKDLLFYVPEKAEKIYVGKKEGHHTLSQEEINKILVKKAKEGKLVVRLKGGDPFLFGRGGEEAEALSKENIPFEVIPGITSAIAVPAYAGIPVTHRNFTSTLAIITGHEAEGKEESKINFEALSKLGTLVFLMGMKNLEAIVEELIKHGKSENTPVAVIRWGTTPYQVTVTGTLKDIVQKVKEKGLKAPAIIVIGEVVKLREILNWFEKKSLFGKKILITRTRKQAGTLKELLREEGALVLEVPVIEIKPLFEEHLKERLKKVSEYDWIIFTSQNGVEIFFKKLFEAGFDSRALGRVKIAVIGKATFESLKRFGIIPDLIPEKEFTQEGLLSAFESIKEEIKGKRIGIFRAKEARDVLPEGLKSLSCEVEVIPVYETILPEESKSLIKKVFTEEKPEVITFTSSSTVSHFFSLLKEVFPDKWTYLLDEVKFASIGPVTSKTLEEFGFKAYIEAKEYTISGLIQAIKEYFSKKEAEVNSG